VKHGVQQKKEVWAADQKLKRKSFAAVRKRERGRERK